MQNTYQIYRQQIHQVTSAKYLGITIEQHLTWKDHINDICHKAVIYRLHMIHDCIITSCLLL